MSLNHREGFLLMILFTFDLAHIVEKSCGVQAEAGRDWVNSGLPFGGEKSVVELNSEAGDALGVGEIGIKMTRPKLHTASGKLFDLLPLWKCGTPHVPKGTFPDHFRPIAVDAL